jgi:hypothetical protein
MPKALSMRIYTSVLEPARHEDVLNNVSSKVPFPLCMDCSESNEVSEVAEAID